MTIALLRNSIAYFRLQRKRNRRGKSSGHDARSKGKALSPDDLDHIDIGLNGVTTTKTELSVREGSIEITLAPHSVNLIELIPA